MADRNIDERFRKPRRTKGTPLYNQRNYVAAGIIAFGGVCWYLYELWPQAQQLKKSELEGKFEPPEALKQHILEAKVALTEPGHLQLIRSLKARANAREDELYVDKEKPQPWYSKWFGQPDV